MHENEHSNYYIQEEKKNSKRHTHTSMILMRLKWLPQHFIHFPVKGNELKTGKLNEISSNVNPDH